MSQMEWIAISGVVVFVVASAAAFVCFLWMGPDEHEAIKAAARRATQ